MLRLSASRRLASWQRFRASIRTSRPLKRHLSSQQFLGESENDVEDWGEYSVILPEEPFVFGIEHIQRRRVPDYISKPPYVLNDGRELVEGINKPESSIALGSAAETRLRNATKLVKKVREYAGSLVKVGVTTNAIDLAVHEFIISHNAYPSPLGYLGFPRSCCTSINNIITHGIPDDRPLENGDIVNIDITVYLDGYHGDTSQTFCVGEVDAKGKELVLVTNQALQAGIQACGPGRPFKGIGNAIHGLLGGKYSVSSQFAGHGIGTFFHTRPWILHHRNDEPGLMKPGHCFTIEPSIIQGRNSRGWIFPDGWTASTENCARSAQAEHTVLITETGVDVLTE